MEIWPRFRSRVSVVSLLLDVPPQGGEVKDSSQAYPRIKNLFQVQGKGGRAVVLFYSQSHLKCLASGSEFLWVGAPTKLVNEEKRTKIQLWFTEVECADMPVSDLLILNNKHSPSPAPTVLVPSLPAMVWSS